MERSVGQRLGGAFVVGGLIGLLMQGIMMAVGMALPGPMKQLVSPVSLVVLGLVGMVLVLTGAYKKIDKVGGFGAAVMFCGLVDSVAGVFMGAAMKDGGKASSGVKACAKFAVVMLGSFTAVGIVLGLLLARTPGVLASMDVEGAARLAPGPEIFLYAFAMGGAISVVGEAVLALTHAPFPAVILGNAFVGILLSIFGATACLEALTGGGLAATIVSAGANAVLGGATIVLGGTPMRAIVLVLVMVLVAVMGMVCGAVMLGRAKAKRG